MYKSIILFLAVGLGLAFFALRSESCACEYIQVSPSPEVSATPEASPSPEPSLIPQPSEEPEAQACGRHCVTNDDCRRLDPNYICYFKTQECRQEHNSEDINCNPAPSPEPSSVPLPDEGIQPLGPAK